MSIITSGIILAKRVLPKGIYAFFKQKKHERYWRRIYAYDRDLFLKHSGLRETGSQEGFEAMLTMDYHSIEKGLALPAPRPGFGRDNIHKLASDCLRFFELYGVSEVLMSAYGALCHYQQFCEENDVAYQDLWGIINQIKVVLAENAEISDSSSGVMRVTREDYWSRAQIDVEAFFLSRKSIRDFSDIPVDEQIVRRAIACALHTPSVCNRQSWRIHFFNGKAAARKALSFQNGNRGFGDCVNAVCLITFVYDGFLRIGERNQGFIDGGMLSMSLVYALHGLGLGTCCLNCSNEPRQDQDLHNGLNIPQNERPIMMIGIGSIKEDFVVAVSRRKKFEEVVVVHD